MDPGIINQSDQNDERKVNLMKKHFKNQNILT